MAADGGTIDVEVSPTPDLRIDSPDGLGEATSVLVDSIEGLLEGLLRSLPLIAIGVVILVVGVLLARALGRGAARAVRRAGGDRVVENLTVRLLRLTVVVAALLLALSVAGVPVGAALAGLGIAGLAIAFAMQSILENFVAGIILIMRKPIRHEDQVIIPNAEVFRSTIVNLTRRGTRRTRVVVGIDYRDDHHAARDLLEAAVARIDGVLATPPPQARCIELGESSVDFELRYWSLPDIGSVVDTRDRVLRGVKSALDDAGMTIPWPIRTVAFDNALEHAPPGPV